MLATTTFSTGHIGTTAVIIGVLSVPAAYWLLRPRSAVTIGAVCAAAALATFGYRLCANMPQLNNDGVPNFSAWRPPSRTSCSGSTRACTLRPIPFGSPSFEPS